MGFRSDVYVRSLKSPYLRPLSSLSSTFSLLPLPFSPSHLVSLTPFFPFLFLPLDLPDRHFYGMHYLQPSWRRSPQIPHFVVGSHFLIPTCALISFNILIITMARVVPFLIISILHLLLQPGSFLWSFTLGGAIDYSWMILFDMYVLVFLQIKDHFWKQT